jgi:sialic acid synthase SpsE
MKIAGFEATDPRFVSMVLSAGLPTIVSLGIGSNFNTMFRILEIASEKGVDDITFLHCNNAYPTPAEDVNLDTIKAMALDNRYRTGFSDHTLSPFTPALAVAVGATVIEKHYTLSKHLPGPDHPFAVEPHELKLMVDYIRYAEKCRGSKEPGMLSPSEIPFGKGMRSVVAKKPIKQGEVLTLDNITTKRPYLPGNIPAIDFNKVLGSLAKEEYSYDDFIKL